MTNLCGCEKGEGRLIREEIQRGNLGDPEKAYNEGYEDAKTKYER